MSFLNSYKFNKKLEVAMKDNGMLHPGLGGDYDGDKILQAFSAVARNPRLAITKARRMGQSRTIAESMQEHLKYGSLIHVDGVSNGISASTYTFADGSSATLTGKKIREAIGELQGKTHTAPFAKQALFCSRHEKELPAHKKKILKYRNKFKKIHQRVPSDNSFYIDNGCIACRLKYK